MNLDETLLADVSAFLRAARARVSIRQFGGLWRVQVAREGTIVAMLVDVSPTRALERVIARIAEVMPNA